MKVSYLLYRNKRIQLKVSHGDSDRFPSFTVRVLPSDSRDLQALLADKMYSLGDPGILSDCTSASSGTRDY